MRPAGLPEPARSPAASGLCRNFHIAVLPRPYRPRAALCAVVLSGKDLTNGLPDPLGQGTKLFLKKHRRCRQSQRRGLCIRSALLACVHCWHQLDRCATTSRASRCTHMSCSAALLAHLRQQRAMQAAAKPAAPVFDKLICIGKNYLEHAKELGDAVPDKPGARAARASGWHAHARGTCLFCAL